MAYIRPYRIAETSTTTGTGSISLSGPITGFTTFANALNGGDSTTYVIEAVDVDGAPTGQWEVTDGVFSTGALTRGTLRASSTGSRIDFSAGTKRIFAIDPVGAMLGANVDITSLGGLTGGIETPAFVDFDLTANPVLSPGRLAWNAANATLGFGLGANNFLAIGQETNFYARNDTSGTITRGTPVMFSGVFGGSGKINFVKAVADGTVPADYMMGVAKEDIAAGEFGYVAAFGEIRGFNASGSPYGESWAIGDLLYFNPATPGTWTKIEPQAPNIHVPVAVVVNNSAGGAGAIFVRMMMSQTLGELQDVRINGTGNPTLGQLLIYDATQKRWENANLSAGTGISVTNADSSVTVTNSAPDQVVTLTGAGTTSVSGTYPSFTVTSADQFVGTVTSVGGAGTVNGLTLTGTVTNSGELTLGGTLTNVDLTSAVTGTLPVANGGTGQTSYTNGQLLIGKTDGTLAKATLTAGANVTITNADGSITIAASGGGGGSTGLQDVFMLMGA